MDPRVAQQIACSCHVGQQTRFGDSVIDHVGQVANGVGSEARAVAWLHEVFELTPVGRETLRAHGLTPVEEQTLELLTRTPTEAYEEYISKIAHAPDRSGELARTVKLADLEDHLGHAQMPSGAPPYAWAHRCVSEQRDVVRSPALMS